jgi:ElaB/YqjD/DUF883 family membrane-anchored ribosome-binding protein
MNLEALVKGLRDVVAPKFADSLASKIYGNLSNEAKQAFDQLVDKAKNVVSDVKNEVKNEGDNLANQGRNAASNISHGRLP